MLVYEFGIDGFIYHGLFRMKTAKSICISELCVSLKVAKRNAMFQSLFRCLLEISDCQY